MTMMFDAVCIPHMSACILLIFSCYLAGSSRPQRHNQSTLILIGRTGHEMPILGIARPLGSLGTVNTASLGP